MATRELPREEWIPFLDSFSKLHQGENATLRIVGDDVGAQEEALSLPFVGVSADDKGSDAGAIIIMLGTETEDHLQHMISKPNHLWLKTGGAIEEEVLEVEDADGTKTILQLEAIPDLPA